MFCLSIKLRGCLFLEITVWHNCREFVSAYARNVLLNWEQEVLSDLLDLTIWFLQCQLWRLSNKKAFIKAKIIDYGGASNACSSTPQFIMLLACRPSGPQVSITCLSKWETWSGQAKIGHKNVLSEAFDCVNSSLSISAESIKLVCTRQKYSSVFQEETDCSATYEKALDLHCIKCTWR